jgi:hypothetical protein
MGNGPNIPLVVQYTCLTWAVPGEGRRNSRETIEDGQSGFFMDVSSGDDAIATFE